MKCQQNLAHAGTAHGQIKFARVLRRVFPTTVLSYLECHGWVPAEGLLGANVGNI